MHMVSSFTRKSEKFLGERKISCDEHQMEGRAWVIERLASKVIAFGVVVGVFLIYIYCVFWNSRRDKERGKKKIRAKHTLHYKPCPLQ